MIKIGTSGYSFPDWKGTVYPTKLQPKTYLSYYQQDLGFDCVEINSTYYSLVSPKMMEGMAKKTCGNFEFTVKSYRGFTHDPFDFRKGNDRPSFAAAFEDVEKFKFSIQPLKDSGKLGAVLLQFPPFFLPAPETRNYLLELKEKFAGIPLAIEFRNRAWAGPANSQPAASEGSTFDFLRKNGLGYCIADEPPLPLLMPFVNEVTSDMAYLRLHGRNMNWFKVSAGERYNYLYSDDELATFIPEIEIMVRESKKVYIFFNNCHIGFAARNAQKMKELLGLGVKNTLF